MTQVQQNPVANSVAEEKQRQIVLEKLLTLPPESVEKLPKAQRELVEYTRRYRQMLTLKPEQIQSMPPHQQQLIKHIRTKLGLQ